MTIRKKYSKEFKLDAVGLVTEQGYTQVEAAKSLGLNANMLGRPLTAMHFDRAMAGRTDCGHKGLTR